MGKLEPAGELILRNDREIEELLALGGFTTALGDLRRVIAARDYVREAGSTKLTSRETLGRELEVVMAAREGRNRHAALTFDGITEFLR